MLGALLGGLVTTARAQSAPQAVGIATDAASRTWLLWNNPDGSAALWQIAPDGSVTTTSTYGPIAGWNCQAVAAGPGTPLLFWKHPADGQTSVWTLTASGTFASSTPGYGPYGPWTASALGVGGEGAARMLWGDGGGQFSVWTVTADGSYTSTAGYGPISGWTATAVAGGSDSLTRLLLNRSDGAAAVWTLDGGGYQSSTPLYGPYGGYACRAVAVGADGLTRLLWVSAGGAGVWTVAGSGGFTSTPLLSTPSGYAAVGIAGGGDNKVRLLWGGASGAAQIWTIGTDGTYTVKVYPSPSALTLSPASVSGGSSSTGTVSLNAPAPPAGLAVALSSSNTAAATVPASVTVPAGATSATFTVTTVSVSAATAATITATANGVSQPATLTVNSALRADNLNNGDTLSGEFLLNILESPGMKYRDGDLTIQIDGSYAGTTGDTQSPGASGTDVSFSIATDEYPNGNHTISISDGVNTVAYQVVFNNDISNITYDDLFDSSGSMSGDGVGTSSTITATTSGPWTVSIQTTDGAGTTVRSYSGTGNINILWDGKDATGNEVDDDAYTVALSQTPSPGPNSPAAHQKATNKQKMGDALLVFDGDKSIFPSGYSDCINYKNYIVQLLKPYKANGSIYKIVAVMIRNPSRLVVPTPKNGNKIDPAVILINKELSTPLRLFYIDTHGGDHDTSTGQQYPYFSLGAYGWYSTIDPSSQRFVGLVNFDMGQLVAPANYGGDFGNNPPGIVWIDSCDSAGSDPNDPQLPAGAPNTGVDAFGFANDFQSGNYFGIFLGWNGYTTNYGAYIPPMDDWTF